MCEIMRLENKSGTLGLLVTTKLEVLATLQRQLELSLAGNAFQSQDDLLCRLGLLVEHGLGLTTITGLLAVVTSLSLREERGLASLVLGNLVLGVLLALLALAVGLTGLGNVDLQNIRISLSHRSEQVFDQRRGQVSCSSSRVCCIQSCRWRAR